MATSQNNGPMPPWETGGTDGQIKPRGPPKLLGHDGVEREDYRKKAGKSAHPSGLGSMLAEEHAVSEQGAGTTKRAKVEEENTDKKRRDAHPQGEDEGRDCDKNSAKETKGDQGGPQGEEPQHSNARIPMTPELIVKQKRAGELNQYWDAKLKDCLKDYRDEGGVGSDDELLPQAAANIFSGFGCIMAPEETTWDQHMKVYEAMRSRDLGIVKRCMQRHYASMDAPLPQPVLSVNALQYAVYCGWTEAVTYLVDNVECDCRSKATWRVGGGGRSLTVPCLFVAITSYLAFQNSDTRANLAKIRSAWSTRPQLKDFEGCNMAAWAAKQLVPERNDTRLFLQWLNNTNSTPTLPPPLDTTALHTDGPRVVVMCDPIFAVARTMPRGLQEVAENTYRVEVLVGPTGILRVPAVSRYVNFVERVRRLTLEEFDAHDFDHLDFYQGVCDKAPHSGDGVVFFDVPVQNSDGSLDADTKVSYESKEASMAGGGAALEGLNLVQNTATKIVYIILRNPGHHCGWKGEIDAEIGCGYCPTNPGALATMRAVEGGHFGRIANVDLDAHRGNGTEQILKLAREKKPEQYSKERFFRGDVYLRTAVGQPFSAQKHASEKGEEGPEADENMWSLPVDIVDDQGVQRQAWRDQVQRIYNALVKLKPELITVSLGLDGLWYDDHVSPSGAGKLLIEDYVWAMRLLKSVGGKLLSFMEGGYSINALNASPLARAHLAVLKVLIAED